MEDKGASVVAIEIPELQVLDEFRQCFSGSLLKRLAFIYFNYIPCWIVDYKFFFFYRRPEMVYSALLKPLVSYQTIDSVLLKVSEYLRTEASVL